MRIFTVLLTSLIALTLSLSCHAGLSVHTLSSQAFNGNINSTSFQQDAITTYNGYQYAVYWSTNRHIAVARRSIDQEQWQILELTDYTFAVDNDHYDISLGVSPRDGTLHLSFYQWSSVFNYRKSIPGILDNPASVNWNASLFGPVQNGLLGSTMQPTTYPRFVTSPSGKLMLLLRHGESGAGDSYLYEYDGNTRNWSGLGKLVDGLATNINAYFNGIHYDPNGRLHASWVWRATPDATTNFDLHYIYSDDDGRTWHNNAGQHIATTGQNPIRQNTSGLRVWQIGQNRGLINQEAQSVDNEGRVSLLMSHLVDSAPSNSDFDVNRQTVRVFHYLRNLNGQWTRSMLPGSAFSYDRNKIAADSQNNLYAVVNRDGIYRATPAGNWQDWTLLQAINDQSIFGEVQLDRQRLAESDVLSFIYVSNQGKILHFEYRDAFAGQAISTAGGGPEGYEFCSFEGETCFTNGTQDVAYGVKGRFLHRTGNGSLFCSRDSVENDPIRYHVKRCYRSVEQTNNSQVPAGYQICAEENQVCQVDQLASVAYGASGRFHYRLTQTPINCNNSEFADPISSTSKQCFVKLIEQSEPQSSSSESSSSSSTSSSSSSSSESSSTSSSAQSSSAPSGTTGGSFGLMLLLLVHAIVLFRGISSET